MTRNPHPDRPDADAEHVQRLLRTLPDPGPMPGDLVERINASLRAERELLGRPVTSGDELSAAAARRTRPARRLIASLAGAAACAAVVGVLGVNAMRTPPSTSTARVGASAGSPQSATRQVGTGRTDPESTLVGSPVVIDADDIHASQATYRAGVLPRQARAFLAAPGPALPPLAAGAVAYGPMATPDGLADCLARLHIGSSGPVVADVARFEGAPAVLVVTRDGARRQARVLNWHCSGVLHGPIDLR